MDTRYKLYICSVHETLKSVDKSGHYTLGNNAIKDVDIMGVITEVSEHRQNPSNLFMVIKVDDGTGVINCLRSMYPEKLSNIDDTKLEEGSKAVWRHLRKRNDYLCQLKVGDTIHAQGTISEFRGKKELKVQKLRLVSNVNEEIHRVFEMEALYRNVYKL